MQLVETKTRKNKARIARDILFFWQRPGDVSSYIGSPLFRPQSRDEILFPANTTPLPFSEPSAHFLAKEQRLSLCQAAEKQLLPEHRYSSIWPRAMAFLLFSQFPTCICLNITLLITPQYKAETVIRYLTPFPPSHLLAWKLSTSASTVKGLEG